MADLTPVVRRVDARLFGLPSAVRNRVLLEVAGDLESLYEHYRVRGMDEAEAVRLAEEKVLASPESLNELIRVHSSGYAGLEASAAGHIHRGSTVFFLIVGARPLIAVAAVASVRQVMTVGASPWLWPLVAVGVAITAITAGTLVRLAGRGEHPRRRGLLPLLFLSGTSIGIGLTGFLASLYSVLIALSRSPDPTTIPTTLVATLGRDAATLCIGILLGMAAGIAWFLLVRRVVSVEGAETAALVGNPGS